ncbi:MAG: PAS domain-containing protein [Bacteroidales bacterium]
MDLQKKYENAQQKINILEKRVAENLGKANELLKMIGTLDNQIFCCQKNKNDEYIIIFNEGKIAEEYNHSTEQTKGNKLRDLIGDELYSKLKPYYDQAFNGEIVKYKGFQFEERYVSTILSPFKKRQDGTVTEIIGNTQDITELSKERYFSTILTPLKKRQDGTVIEIVGNTKDITELYHIEEKYKETMEILDKIIELNPYSIQILDADGHHISGNKAFIELFIAAPPNEWTIFNDPLLKERFGEKLISLIKEEVVTTPQTWYNPHFVDPNCPDNPICISSVSFPVFLSDGKLECIVVMHENITGRMKAEEDLKTRITELEDFHDLTVGRELKMKKMEEEMEELKKKIKNNNK